MSEQAVFYLDDAELPFTAGQTILQAAQAAGHFIPHLCYREGFAPHGSCKVCSVRANGRYTSACFEPVTPGMKVESESEAMRDNRRRVVQMLFSEGNHICPSCEKSGNCQLQAVAYYLDMQDTHYPHQYPQRQLDASHPEVLIDHDRCILCELCVRASHDIDHKSVFGVAGRGISARLVINSASGLLGDSTFAITDAAASVCPVGAILPKRHGFEVPIGARLFDHKDAADAALPHPDKANSP